MAVWVLKETGHPVNRMKSPRAGSHVRHKTGMTQRINEKAGTLQQTVLLPYTKSALGDFPGGPVVKDSALPLQGHSLDPWLGNQEPCMSAQPKKTEKEQVGSRWIKYLNEKNKMLKLLEDTQECICKLNIHKGISHKGKYWYI